jgi:hypothetical protein
MLDCANGNLNFTKVEEQCHQNCSFPSQFSPHMVLSQHQRQLETSSLRFCYIHLTVPITHLANFIPLFHVKGITWSRVWECEEVKETVHAFDLPSSLMGSGSLRVVSKGM